MGVYLKHEHYRLCGIFWSCLLCFMPCTNIFMKVINYFFLLCRYLQVCNVIKNVYDHTNWCFVIHVDICISLACFLSLQNELSSDLSHPSPDSQTDLPVTGGPRTIHVPIHIQGGTVQPLHSTPQAPHQDSSTFLTEDPRTIHVPIHVERLSPGLADPSSLPGDMEHLTTGLPEVVTSTSNKTPPFPTHNDPSWEAVPKKVNFDLDATTEISNDQRSSVGEDFEERPSIDHVSVFLTQGANCSPQNTNGYLGNGVRPDSLDSPTDLTFIDIDDANVAHFRRDVSPLSGHMTLPAPKKTTDSEVITPFFLTPFFTSKWTFAFILLCVYIYPFHTLNY